MPQHFIKFTPQVTLELLFLRCSCLLTHGVQTTLAGMQTLRRAIDDLASSPQHHTALHEATAHVHAMCLQLISCKFAKEALPYAVHAALAFESSLVLRSPQYLAKRCSLVFVVCAAYEALHENKMAVKLVQHVEDDICSLQKTFALDPVPQPAEFRAQISDAHQRLLQLRFRFEAHGKAGNELVKELEQLQKPQQKLEALLAALCSPERRTCQQSDSAS